MILPLPDEVRRVLERRERTVEDWARSIGISRRTLHRRLVTATGAAPRAWMQLVRALRVARAVADGTPVRIGARRVGEDQFIASAMMRRACGLRPGTLRGKPEAEAIVFDGWCARGKE